MRIHRCGAVVLALQISAGALGQAAVSVYDAAFMDYDADLSLMPQVGVGPSYTVVFGSHRMMLFDKSVTVDPANPSSLLDDAQWNRFIGGGLHPWGYAQYPFKPFYDQTPYRAWITYPRADYDPITDTVWMIASESNQFSNSPPPLVEQSVTDCDFRALHVAVPPEGSGVTTFLSCDDLLATPPDCWNYLTASGAIDVGNSNIERYGVAGHEEFAGPPRFLSVGFDERAVMVAAVDPLDCSGLVAPEQGQCLLILEREFDDGMGGTTTYHDGGVPDPTDMTMVRFSDLPFPDNVRGAMIVQEPYDHEKANPEFENLTLIISTDGSRYTAGTPGSIEGLRLRGVYWDSAASRWVVRQALKPAAGGGLELREVDLNSPFLGAAFGSTSLFAPELPDSSQVYVDDESITSAVLAEDWLGNNRVFAVNAGIQTFGQGQSIETRWVVQWYVIDPKLGNFYSSVPEAWAPTLIAQGRITTDGAPEPNAGDCYLPTIGVSRCGQVFVEYTFSSDTVYPQIRRAVLNYGYTAVQSTSLVQAGPAGGYRGPNDRWGMYPDMQADPASARFWSSHTLIDSSNVRDAWVFKTSYNCFQVDMNRDGIVDPLDMALYTDLYGQGHERADTNADDTVDVVDMLNFVHDYGAATGP